jgi:seryl-tRNA synthetase
MSFAEMEAMMYKIEGEDLFLIGTSEHSMIGKFIDTILPESALPQTLTSYSPCFRKEKGAHGLEERGFTGFTSSKSRNDCSMQAGSNDVV